MRILFISFLEKRVGGNETECGGGGGEERGKKRGRKINKGKRIDAHTGTMREKDRERENITDTQRMGREIHRTQKEEG